jgi:hypothetical protein
MKIAQVIGPLVLLVFAVPSTRAGSIASPVVLEIAAPVRDASSASATKSEAPDAAFKSAFDKLAAKKDKAEMAKLVHAQVKDAVEWIAYTCAQISVQSSDELENFMVEMREAWKTAQKSEFAEKIYRYFSSMSGAAKKDRAELKKRYDKAFDDMQKNLEKKDSFVFQNIVDEFDFLGASFDQIGDLYDSSQAYLACAACSDEPLRGTTADLNKAYDEYVKAIDARDRTDLKDPPYEEAVRRKAALVAKGYDKKKKDAAAPTPTPTSPPDSPPAGPAGSTITAPLAFEVVPSVELYQRPVYADDEIYVIWNPLGLTEKGSSATFRNLPDSPPFFRMGASDVRIDTNGDNVGDEKVNLSGNISPTKIMIGKGDDQRPWAFLCVTGMQKDNFQNLEVNFAPSDKAMTIYTFAAASVVGTIGTTQVRVIDESMDGVYGNPPQTWGFDGLSKGSFEPLMDSIVIGASKRARPWSEYQEIEGKWFKLDPITNGKELKASPVNVDKGVLKLDYKGPAPTWLVVRGDGEYKNSFFDLAEAGAKGVAVPAGKYTLYYGDVRKGKKRQTQKTLILPGKSTPVWTVAKGATTLVTLGAPYGFDFQPAYASEKLSIEGASVVIVGSQGERYERTWNCVPKPEVEWRQKGAKQGRRAGHMNTILDIDTVTKLGWPATWFPIDFKADLKGAGDKVEVQLSEKKHDLFGKIESAWKE